MFALFADLEARHLLNSFTFFRLNEAIAHGHSPGFYRRHRYNLLGVGEKDHPLAVFLVGRHSNHVAFRQFALFAIPDLCAAWQIEVDPCGTIEDFPQLNLKHFSDPGADNLAQLGCGKKALTFAGTSEVLLTDLKSKIVSVSPIVRPTFLVVTGKNGKQRPSFFPLLAGILNGALSVAISFPFCLAAHQAGATTPPRPPQVGRFRFIR